MCAAQHAGAARDRIMYVYIHISICMHVNVNVNLYIYASIVGEDGVGGGPSAEHGTLIHQEAGLYRYIYVYVYIYI